jgi:hypothetical protein
MRVAFATCSLVPDGWPDDHEAASLLGADFQSWDDPDVDWSQYDPSRLAIRLTYQHRLRAFLAWCHSIGPERLRKTPGLVAFTADKRYLSTLSVPSIPTTFVGPRIRLPSSGARSSSNRTSPPVPATRADSRPPHTVKPLR